MRMRALLLALVAMAMMQGDLLALEAATVTILKPPRVCDEDIDIVRVYRISAPYYQTGNDFHSEGDPFNRDCTRMLFLELDSASRKAPLPARGYVSGKITELIAWKTFDEYRAAARPIMKKFEPRDVPGFSLQWSPHPGEENILYALRKSRKMVIRINADTQEEQDVVSYDPGNGLDVSPRACGWTPDGFLIVVMHDRGWPTLNGGFEVDVLQKTRKAFDAWPEPKKRAIPDDAPAAPPVYENYQEWIRYRQNNLGSGHGGRSPSGRYAITQPGHVSVQAVLDHYTGKSYRFDYTKGDEANRVHPFVHNYSNWNASENWYVMNSSGEQGVNGKPAFGNKPEIQDFPVWQVHFFGERNPAAPFATRKLMVVRSSCGWYDEKKNLKYMESSRIHVNISKDARWLYFLANDGNYNEVDYIASKENPEFAYVGQNWSTGGVHLAECVRAKK